MYFHVAIREKILTSLIGTGCHTSYVIAKFYLTFDRGDVLTIHSADIELDLSS